MYTVSKKGLVLESENGETIALFIGDVINVVFNETEVIGGVVAWSKEDGYITLDTSSHPYISKLTKISLDGIESIKVISDENDVVAVGKENEGIDSSQESTENTGDEVSNEEVQ